MVTSDMLNGDYCTVTGEPIHLVRLDNAPAYLPGRKFVFVDNMFSVLDYFDAGDIVDIIAAGEPHQSGRLAVNW